MSESFISAGQPNPELIVKKDTPVRLHVGLRSNVVGWPVGCWTDPRGLHHIAPPSPATSLGSTGWRARVRTGLCHSVTTSRTREAGENKTLKTAVSESVHVHGQQHVRLPEDSLPSASATHLAVQGGAVNATV